MIQPIWETVWQFIKFKDIVNIQLGYPTPCYQPKWNEKYYVHIKPLYEC